MLNTDTEGAAPHHPALVTAVERRDRALEAARRACRAIAPTWPLDRFIAVNPFWPRIDRPFSEVAADLRAASGAQLLPPRRWYRELWPRGAAPERWLRAAGAELDPLRSLPEMQASLQRDPPATTPRPRVMDLASEVLKDPAEGTWRSWVLGRTSQFCAAYFDDGQAQLHPPKSGGLFAAWLRQARVDRAPSWWLSGRRYQEALAQVSGTAREWIPAALTLLEVAEPDGERYLNDLLLDLNGWASWCAYRRWQAQLVGGDDDHLLDLLAVRLVWEWVLLHAGGDPLRARWRAAMERWPRARRQAATEQQDGWIFQRALELEWQEQTAQALESQGTSTTPAEVRAQVVCCIDVRSEILRRALETVDPSIQTLGFAGFFGLPIEFQALGSDTPRPQLPGLLAPRLRVEERGHDAPDGAIETRAIRRDQGWKAFRTHPVSSFAFVDAAGLSYAVELLAEALRLRRDPPVKEVRPLALRGPEGEPLSLEDRARLAEGMLRGMSLTQGFAPWVVLLGHGSECRNNAHRAGLDCGACGGQSGLINARVAASLLNDPEVRRALSERRIIVPPNTVFLAGLHNTTTDDVTLLGEGADAASTDLTALRSAFADAGARARRERARQLPGVAPAGDQVERAIATRARDWAEVRPEWGLAGNAGFIAAPRERTRGLDLGGRVFLHEYRWEQDPQAQVLEQIMTAPMVVAHWINLQYYASTVDPERYGSGNKLLHNVVGGHLGVFEGNGGDLRIGLPLQSVYDGARWVHPPLRLSVFLEAPTTAIDAVLAKHSTVRQLVEGEWLYLFQIDPATGRVLRRRGATWAAREFSE